MLEKTKGRILQAEGNAMSSVMSEAENDVRLWQETMAGFCIVL